MALAAQNINLELASSYLKQESTRQLNAYSYTVQRVAAFHAKGVRLRDMQMSENTCT